eukprot:2494944-Amphidinium_carterae.1
MACSKRRVLAYVYCWLSKVRNDPSLDLRRSPLSCSCTVHSRQQRTMYPAHSKNMLLPVYFLQ